MRLDDFRTIDELVEIGIIEFEKRAHAPALSWIPPRQNVYSSQSIKYSKMIADIINSVSFQSIIDSGINPSQFIKSSQDYQVAARIAGEDKAVVLDNFLRIANIGMRLKRHYYHVFMEKARSIDYNYNQDYLIKIDQLNGLLRAFSETVYFDDHTVSGEFYGDITVNDKPVVVRSYNRLCPRDYLPCFDGFYIKTIETYCVYNDNNLDFDCLGNILYLDKKRPSIIAAAIQYSYIDGRSCFVKTTEDLLNLISTLEKQLKVVFMLIESMDLYTKQKYLLSSSYYAFKPLLDIIAKPWIPTNEDIESYVLSMENKRDFYKDKKSSSNDQDVYRIVDPRKAL